MPWWRRQDTITTLGAANCQAPLCCAGCARPVGDPPGWRQPALAGAPGLREQGQRGMCRLIASRHALLRLCKVHCLGKLRCAAARWGSQGRHCSTAGRTRWARGGGRQSAQGAPARAAQEQRGAVQAAAQAGRAAGVCSRGAARASALRCAGEITVLWACISSPKREPACR